MLARRGVAGSPLAETSVEVLLGDLQDADCLSRLVAGASVLVHAAGATKAGSRAAFQATNVEGTARLAAAAARDAPGCRVVHISSQAARHPALSAYAASKRDGEGAMAAALGDTPWVILRPAIIYGAGDDASTALLRLAALPVVPIPTRPEPRLALVHVRDAAAAVVAFCAPQASGRLYEVCDGSVDGHSWRDIVRAARAASAAPRLLPVPDGVLMACGTLADAWSALSGRPSMFGRGKAREILQRDWRPDATLRPPEAVWTSKIGLQDGMHDTRAGHTSSGSRRHAMRRVP